MMISFKCQVHPPQQPSSPRKVNKLANIYINYQCKFYIITNQKSRNSCLNNKGNIIAAKASALN